MKLSVFLFVVSLVIPISAFSDPGAYERLFYWYAYTMDTARTKVATGCSKSVSSKSPCTFSQFMKYIDMNPEELHENEIKNVDTTDVQRTFRALVKGGYTGTYSCKSISPGIKGKNDVAKLMQTVTGFLAGQIGTASDQRKLNLQQVTTGIFRTRQAASISSLSEDFEKKGITIVTKQIPAFDGSADQCESIDVGKTAKASGKGPLDMKDLLLEVFATNDDGHSQMIEAAKGGAAAVSNACLG